MKTRRIMATFLAGILLLSVFTFNAAAQVEWTYISTASAGLSFSGTTATCSTTLSAYSGMGVATSTTTCYLQRSSNGTSWTNITSWTDTESGTWASAGGTYSVSTGYYYRVYGTYRVYNSGGTTLETATATSSIQQP